jgi:hypothetical protein
VDGPRGPGGRSAPLGFVPCSSCSCSPFVSIRHDFGFRLDGVSDGPQQREDGPRVPGGQSACSRRTVRGAVRPCWFCLVLTDGPRLRLDSPRQGGGQSAVPCRTVRAAHRGRSALSGRTVRLRLRTLLLGSIPPLLLSCFRVCFKESFLRLEVDP